MSTPNETRPRPLWDEWRERLEEDTRHRTHYEGCERVHWRCAMLALLDELAHVRELYEREREIFPADGVWVVRTTDEGRESALVSRVADLPDPIPLARIALHRNAVAQAVIRVRDQSRSTLVLDPPDASARWTYPSPMDVAREIVDALHADGAGTP